MRTNAVLFMIAAFLLVGFVFATADLTGEAYAAGIPPGCQHSAYTTKGVIPPGQGPCAVKPGKGL